MIKKEIFKGCSMLNAADETANPYGLILSQVERDQLTCLDNVTNALLHGRTGRKQQFRATLTTVAEFFGMGIAMVALSYLLNTPKLPAFVIGVSLLVVQKLNLLLTPEKITETHERRMREDEKESARRAKYFKDMGGTDMSLEE